jgi:peptidoglycan/LPS O-acetylase OafA/YrhL
VSATAHQERLQYLDALRAVAALLVVWMHVSEAMYNLSPATETSRWLYDIAYRWDFGRIGVVTFFAISGFVIPFSARPDQPGAGWDFAIKRLFRIYPAYWLSIPAGAYAGYWIWGREFTALDFLINLSLMQDVVGVQSAIGLYWTLLVELTFYAICLLFLVSGNIRNYSRIAFCAGAVTALVFLWMLAHGLGRGLFSFTITLWLMNLSIMATGTLFRAYRDGELRSVFSRVCLFGLLGFYLFGLPLVSSLFAGLPWRYTLPYSFGLALFLLGTSVLHIRNPVMTWLGQISYSIYLFHPVVFSLLLWNLLKLPVDAWWRTQSLGFYLALVTVITVAIASLIYLGVEKPFMQLGRRLVKRRAIQHRTIGLSTQPEETDAKYHRS